jgi:transposase
MAFIRKVKTASGATAVQIAQKSYGKITHIEHIGSAHNDEELNTLLALAGERLDRFQLSLFNDTHDPATSSFQISLRKSFSRLLFDVLKDQFSLIGFDALCDEDFALLCIARIVEATSKLDSIRVLSDLGIEGLTKDRFYRCLKRCALSDYRARIAQICIHRSIANGITLVLYDVTTLYFEVQEEDEYRKSGMSKERRLEPQIVVGLLVDQNGFPLVVHSFEGNKAETNTILPVINEFRQRHNLKDIVVVADAAMMSAKNLQALSEAGYRYIVASRLHRIPYDIVEYQKDADLFDNQIITQQKEGYRIIYQYRQKRAKLDLRNIEKQIIKAQKIVNGLATAKKAKFLTIKTREKSLNQRLIEKATALAGIKGYVTNLDIADEQVIAYYHQLFQIEASFRMAKSDLKARPIFHQTRHSIDAHLTVVFAALAIARVIELKTGISIKTFVKILRPMRNGILTINGKEYVAQPEINSAAQRLIDVLNAGH